MDPRLPPGLWYPLPVSQSVHTDLLNARTVVLTAGPWVPSRGDEAEKDTGDKTWSGAVCTRQGSCVRCQAGGGRGGCWAVELWGTG